jgi:hypothetical protein
MPARKRNREELELPSVDVTVPAPQQTLLSRLRNMWEFANLMQYIFIFGKAVKISEDFDIEVGYISYSSMLVAHARYTDSVIEMVMLMIAHRILRQSV